MSNKEQDRVWEHSAQRGIGLVVMLAIANRADDNGICWPGQKDLAKRARVSRRSIQRYIDSASADGEVAVVERPGKSHLYVVLVGLPDEEKRRRLDLVAAGNEVPEPAPASHPHLRQPDAPPAPARRTACASQSIPGAQVPVQIGQPGAQVYAQSGRRTIIEPSVEPPVTTSGWAHRLYLSTFSEPVISKEQDLLTEMTGVYSERDIIDAMGITKKASAKKRIIGKCAYMQGILQRWAKYGRDPEPEDDDDDDVAPHIGFGRTLIDLRPEKERLHANA